MFARFLTVCLLTSFVLRTCAQTPQLTISSAYPDYANYSRVILTCKNRTYPANGAEFRWNSTSRVEDVMNVDDSEAGVGVMTVVLTPEKEGYFTCTSNGTTSNQMALAAQPFVKNSTIDVYVPPYDIRLPCGIQPGALVQKYCVNWNEIMPENNSPTILNVSTFSLPLNITPMMHGTVYECQVTIDHNGTRKREYSGGHFKIVARMESEPQTKPTHILIGTCVFVCTAIIIMILITILFKTCTQKRKRVKKSHLKRIEFSSGSHGDSSNDNLQFEVRSDTHHGIDHETNVSAVADECVRSNEESIVECNLETVPQLSLHVNDDDQDPDSITAISSMIFSDDSSFSPNIEESMHSSLFPSTSEAPSYVKRPTSLHCCNPLLSPCEYRKRKSQSVDIFSGTCGNECANPHCPCQDLRTQEILRNTDFSKTCESMGMNVSTIPVWMHRVCVLRDCTDEGIHYTSEKYGFSLEIPMAAIPEGMSLTIEVGVSLYGPFNYPENVQCVSPIMWICVRDFENFHFLKPVKITMQHCLSIDDTITFESLGLDFLKAGHSPDQAGNHTFSRSDGSVSPGCSENYLTLSTNHFCFLCITSNVSPDAIQRKQYCLSPFYPQPILPNENEDIHFYVSFFLEACLTTIAKQCGGKAYKRITPRRFSFNDHSKEKSVTIQFSEPENWILSLQCNEEINAEDVDFQHKDHEQLQFEEKQGMYPPKFTIGILSLPEAKSTKVNFNFSGANRRIVMDIPLQMEGCARNRRQLLTPDHCSSPVNRVDSPRKQVTSPYRSGGVSLALIDFMEYVAVHVRTKWRFFGIMIDIPPDVLDTFPALDCLQCYSRVFDFWVRRGTPSVSWDTVVSVLESETLDEKKLADNIRTNFIPSVLPGHRDQGHSTPSESFQHSRSSDSGYATNASNTASLPTMMVSDL